MGRRRYVFDEARVQRFLAEGRGKGEGPDYRPWLQIQDIPSLGRSHRPYGIKTNRVHHLLSDGEWKSFLKLEAMKDVTDIREQFPLDRHQTYRMAMNLGYRHPITLDGTPYIMTIDFLVTVRTTHGRKLVPYTFKYFPETLKRREQELIEIAAAFWRMHGCELQLIDQTFFNEELVINYDAVRSCFDISNMSFYRTSDVAGIASALRQMVAVASPEPLGMACRYIAERFGVSPTDVFVVAKHLMARNVLEFNLSTTVGLESLCLCEFRLTAQNVEGKP